jgi:hypothetical protein
VLGATTVPDETMFSGMTAETRRTLLPSRIAILQFVLPISMPTKARAMGILPISYFINEKLVLLLERSTNLKLTVLYSERKQNFML